MLELPTVVPYFDLSLQHASAPLLRSMKRWGSGDRFTDLIARIRADEPDAAFRSSFIVGFPGETEADHDELLGFLREVQLDWAGFFPFSAEDGTPAATLDGQIPAELAAERLRECSELQDPITQAARDALVGESGRGARRRHRHRLRECSSAARTARRPRSTARARSPATVRPPRRPRHRARHRGRGSRPHRRGRRPAPRGRRRDRERAS